MPFTPWRSTHSLIQRKHTPSVISQTVSIHLAYHFDIKSVYNRISSQKTLQRYNFFLNKQKKTKILFFHVNKPRKFSFAVA